MPAPINTAVTTRAPTHALMRKILRRVADATHRWISATERRSRSSRIGLCAESARRYAISVVKTGATRSQLNATPELSMVELATKALAEYTVQNQPTLVPNLAA